VNKTTKTVTEIEYNESGQVIRETKTVTETSDRATGGYVPYPSQPWGEYPPGGYGGHTRPRSPFDYTFTLNSHSDRANVAASGVGK
jgi:hypothetical protein